MLGRNPHDYDRNAIENRLHADDTLTGVEVLFGKAIAQDNRHFRLSWRVVTACKEPADAGGKAENTKEVVRDQLETRFLRKAIRRLKHAAANPRPRNNGCPRYLPQPFVRRIGVDHCASKGDFTARRE
jgi:hypothetical protein